MSLPGWVSFQVGLVVSSSIGVVRQEADASDKDTTYYEEDPSAKFSCVPKPTVLACTDGGWEEDGGPLIKLRLVQYRLMYL